MKTNPKLEAIEDWVIREALGQPDIAEMFSGFCERLVAAGIPVERAMLSWATLHPLVEAESVLWRSGREAELAQYRHDEEDTEDWLKSPIRAVLEARETRLRRHLSGANAATDDFPILTTLKADGFTDYLILSTPFELPTAADFGPSGILVTWATRAEGGFSDDDIEGLDYLQIRLALACRSTIQSRIARTLAETYLGARAGSRVLSGLIRHGDGERLDAVIFYSDLRGSTALADRLAPDVYMAHLNAYFDATARTVMAHGGEVLDFIGDAVLAVFPIEAGGFDAAVSRALRAADAVLVQIERAQAATEHPLHCGIALSSGDVMFGNIGIPERLTFSVIGRTVNAAARIEAMTKTLGRPLLVTADIAAFAPHAFTPLGRFQLAGFGEEVELHAPV
ncbi:adenylate/guanylate cyclase domain-containing protein [Stappia sp. TSB10P1A]|uniref:adenylate/guanylate cyclase domain-containing protein n=1 Tax=Stappia sp. TSB10P1A TaxID=2003585 RepID=UPI001AD8CE8C|nr:adenylate/guanylate cyclase domain-containing protein [Stappia sp. TSB10P1A]